MPVGRILQREYLSLGRKKERNHYEILAAPSVRCNTDKRAIFGRKGVKKAFSSKELSLVSRKNRRRRFEECTKQWKSPRTGRRRRRRCHRRPVYPERCPSDCLRPRWSRSSCWVQLNVGVSLSILRRFECERFLCQWIRDQPWNWLKVIWSCCGD